MTLTPKAVVPNPAPADKELIIVVCTDEEGHVHNHYIRDAALKETLAAEDGPAYHDAVLERAVNEIAAAQKSIETPITTTE